MPDLETAKAVYRGEEARHHFYVEHGLAPKVRRPDDWLELGGFNLLTFQAHPSELPLHEQRGRRGKGRLSKSMRNLKK